jgi:hypothetical protein
MIGMQACCLKLLGIKRLWHVERLSIVWKRIDMIDLGYRYDNTTVSVIGLTTMGETYAAIV